MRTLMAQCAMTTAMTTAVHVACLLFVMMICVKAEGTMLECAANSYRDDVEIRVAPNASWPVVLSEGQVNGGSGSCTSLTNDASKVVDNNVYTSTWSSFSFYGDCTHCDSYLYVQFDLGSKQWVSKVHKWLYWGDRRAHCNQKVAISETGSFTGEETIAWSCYTQVTECAYEPEDGRGSVLEFEPVWGRYVRFSSSWSNAASSSQSVRIMEVHVYIIQPTCTSCPASQTSSAGSVGVSSCTCDAGEFEGVIYNNDVCTNNCDLLYSGVDGTSIRPRINVIDGDITTKALTSKGLKVWIRLDLLQPMIVHAVTVWAGIATYTMNAQIYTGNINYDAKLNTLCGTLATFTSSSSATASETITCHTSPTASSIKTRYVWIYKEYTTASYLAPAEVNVTAWQFGQAYRYDAALEDCIRNESVSSAGSASGASAAVSVVGSVTVLACSSSCNPCSSQANVLSGSILSTYYPNNAYCSWIIESTPVATITLTLSYMNTELNYDWLTLYSCTTSACTTRSTLARVSGTALSGPYTSSTGYAQIVFTSDSSVQKYGFTVDWSIDTSTAAGASTTSEPMKCDLTAKDFDSGGQSLYESDDVLDNDWSTGGLYTAHFTSDPWLRIDLGTERIVRDVRWVTRSDCCQWREHSAEVYVGNDYQYATNNMLCGNYSFLSGGGQQNAWVYCASSLQSSNVKSRYVFIYRAYTYISGAADTYVNGVLMSGGQSVPLHPLEIEITGWRIPSSQGVATCSTCMSGFTSGTGSVAENECTCAAGEEGVSLSSLTGEIVVSSSRMKYVKFEYSGTANQAQHTITFSSSRKCDMLVVAGGGGGGRSLGGGGGAGGLIWAQDQDCSGTYTIYVGKGGQGYNSATKGDNGQNSMITKSGFYLQAIGGGGAHGQSSAWNAGGASTTCNDVEDRGGQDGGSGGGGTLRCPKGGYGTLNQGNEGGKYGIFSDIYAWNNYVNQGGGGGGAYAEGKDNLYPLGTLTNDGYTGTASNVQVINAPDGGEGRDLRVFFGDGIGEDGWFAGGGGGGGVRGNTGNAAKSGVFGHKGEGGKGGGGAGAFRVSNNAALASGIDAISGTGGGGGGGDGDEAGDGASGIVVIRYADITCTQCTGNTYKSSLGDGSCISCSANSVSNAAKTACECNAGYQPDENGGCVACPINTFKAAAGDVNCTDCRLNSETSASGSTVDSDCECVAGYYNLNGADDCQECPQGTYKDTAGNGQACTTCPVYSTTADTGNDELNDCVCDLGYTGLSASSCVPCATGTYKNFIGSGSCTTCPTGSTSPAGSNASTDCVCESPPYTGPIGGPCECSPGYFLQSIPSNWNFESRTPYLELSDGQASGSLSYLGSKNLGSSIVVVSSSIPTSEGILWELGGAGAGAVFYVEGSVPTQYLHISAGAGDTFKASSDDKTAVIRISLPDSRIPQDGTVVELVLIVTQPGELKFYIDKVLIDSATCTQFCHATCTDSSTHYWHGNDNAKLNGYSNSVVVNNLANTAWQGTISGKMQVFEQTTDEVTNQNYFVANSGASNCTLCEANHYCIGGNQSQTACPGNALSDVGSDELLDCISCFVGKYEGSSGNCTNCPSNSNSTEGSNAVTNCTCNPGYTGADGGPCEACVAGKYKDITGSANCTSCPSNSYSDAGSDAVTNCVCNVGYSGPDGGACTACLAGKYKDITGSAPCTDCPSNTVSDEASDEEADCVCNVGYRVVNVSSASCEACETGKYKNTSGNEECVSCPANSTSPPASTSVTACSCNGGYAGADGGACTQCAVNAYENTSTDICSPCPANSQSPAGSDDVTDCICNAGYTGGVNGTACLACEAGKYKAVAGSEACTECASNEISPSASTAVDTCVCVPGYFLDGGVCTECASGTFKNTTGDGSCTNCPSFSTTQATASTSLSDCICNAGYAGEDGEVCTLCLANTYEDANVCTSCPENSVSPEGSSTATACECYYDYTGPWPDGAECTACEDGKYKPFLGSGDCINCPTNSICRFRLVNCTEGSTCTSGTQTGQTDIFCNAGYVKEGSTCIACAAGTYDANTSETCLPCPNYTTSASASTAYTDCKCNAGYTGADGGNCTACQANTYKNVSGSSQCEACTLYSTSPAGSVNITDCVCDADYVHAGDGSCDRVCAAGFEANLNESLCVACGHSKYKVSNGDEACTPCPANSTHSLYNQTSINACICQRGFVFNASTQVCDACELGQFNNYAGETLCFDCFSNSSGVCERSLKKVILTNVTYFSTSEENLGFCIEPCALQDIEEVEIDDKFNYIKFSNNGLWQGANYRTPYRISFSSTVLADILLVGGGGGGASYAGGGGGAGGVLYGSVYMNASVTYTLGVGIGGTHAGLTGEDTFMSGWGVGKIYARGGGGGISDSEMATQPRDGGSGGGVVGYIASDIAGGVSTQTSYTIYGDTMQGYGNAGGMGRLEEYGSNWGTDWTKAGSGGGGAGGPGFTSGNYANGTGQPARLAYGGNGGVGISIDITGTPTYYAGGGGGGVSNYQNINASLEDFPGLGGLGGGGNAGYPQFGTTANSQGASTGGNGVHGLGGGGGAAGARINGGGLGGHGVVIIKYQKYDYVEEAGNANTVNTLSCPNICQAPAGYEILGTSNLQLCPINTYNNGSYTTCQTCPDNSYTSQRGSTSILDCECVAGYFRNVESVCEACAIGTFKSVAGNSTCSVCPSNMTTISTASTACMCEANFQPNDANTTCHACPDGEAKHVVGNLSCIACTAHATLQSGYPHQSSSCLCNPGYTGNHLLCSACPIGSYKSTYGPGNCTSCAEFATTVSYASSNISDCECVVFYEASPLGGPDQVNGSCVPSCALGTFELNNSCVNCSQGFYKDTVDSASCTPCADPRNFSKSGADSAKYCTCHPGQMALNADVATLTAIHGFLNASLHVTGCTAMSCSIFSARVFPVQGVVLSNQLQAFVEALSIHLRTENTSLLVFQCQTSALCSGISFIPLFAARVEYVDITLTSNVANAHEHISLYSYTRANASFTNTNFEGWDAQEAETLVTQKNMQVGESIFDADTVVMDTTVCAECAPGLVCGEFVDEELIQFYAYFVTTNPTQSTSSTTPTPTTTTSQTTTTTTAPEETPPPAETQPAPPPPSAEI